MSNGRSLEIRVATGISERHLSSAIWRIWQGKNKDDIYIASRGIAGVVKCSFHANRYCYVGFTKQFAEASKAKGRYVPENREIVNWQRPLTPETGPLFVAEIWLVPAPLYTLDQPVPDQTWVFEPPPIGKAVVIEIVYSRKPEGVVRIPPDVRVIDGTQLKSADCVTVFARPVDFDYDEFAKERFPEIQANFARNPQFIVSDEKAILQPRDSRMYLINDPNVDGRLKILDAAVQWNPDKPA